MTFVARGRLPALGDSDDRLPGCMRGVGPERGGSFGQPPRGPHIRSQSSVAQPLGELGQLGAIGLNDEEDRPPVLGLDRGRFDRDQSPLDCCFCLRRPSVVAGGDVTLARDDDQARGLRTARRSLCRRVAGVWASSAQTLGDRPQRASARTQFRRSLSRDSGGDARLPPPSDQQLCVSGATGRAAGEDAPL